MVTMDLIDNDDYERFEYYASLIRVITLEEYVESSGSQYTPVAIHPGTFAAFQGYSKRKGGKCLLPNLRAATLILGSNDYFMAFFASYLHCWLPQGLRSLTLEHQNDKFQLSKDICKNIVSLIVRNCSNIVTLNVGDSDFFEGIDDTHLLDLLMGLHKLQNVRGPIHSILREKIRLLGSLSSLKSIEGLVLSQKTDMASFATADGLFQSTEQLQLRTPDWDTVATLLRTMNCSFTALDIQLEHLDDLAEDLPTSHGFQNLTSAFTSNVFLRKTLKSITLTDLRGYNLHAELPSSAFQPFLSLRALQHVILRMGDLDRLNDLWLADAAIAWPDLRTLIISTVDHCFSLKGLIPLLKNCRKITTLEVHPTATDFDLSLLPADGSASNTNITGLFSLNEVEADEMDPEALFACLTAMFPSITGVKRADGTLSVDFDCSDERQEKWAMLGQMFVYRSYYY